MRLILAAILLALTIAPGAGDAQPAQKTARVGVLSHGAAATPMGGIFVQRLRDLGWVEGNLRIERRDTEGSFQLDRFRRLAMELVGEKVDVIFAAQPYALRAAHEVTSVIPVVGADLESDPVRSGLAASLSRPGGNVTGIFLDLPDLAAKHLQLMTEVVPRLSRVGVLWDANVSQVQFTAVQEAARVLSVEIQSLEVRSPEGLETVFRAAAHSRVPGLVVLSSPLVWSHRASIAAFVVKQRLPAISLFADLAEAGMLLAYGPSLPEIYREAAGLVDRILRGGRPGDIPINRPARFQLVLNLKTAKAMGLAIPPSLLLRADQVIE